jgi:hypothetical protein
LNKENLKINPIGIIRVILFAFAIIISSSANAVVFHIQSLPDEKPLVEQTLNRNFIQLTNILKTDFPDTIYVVIAHSQSEFDQAVGAGLPDWGAAVAVKERRLIVVKSPSNFAVGKSLEELLGHELGHLVLEKASADKWLPRWIEEGFCQLISGEWKYGQDFLLTRAVWGDGLIPLTLLEEVNRFGDTKAALAYAESYLAVNMMVRDVGIEFFPDFLEGYRKSGNFYDAFFKASGYRYTEFAQIWQNKTTDKYRFILYIFDSRLFFPLLAIIFILLYFVKLWQVRKKKKEWERLERFYSDDETYST